MPAWLARALQAAICAALAAKGLVAAHPRHAYVEQLTESSTMAAKIRFANRHFHLPQSKPIRIGLGILLVACGLVGFLPVVGFWMIPLGLLVLSVDIPSCAAGGGSLRYGGIATARTEPRQARKAARAKPARRRRFPPQGRGLRLRKKAAPAWETHVSRKAGEPTQDTRGSPTAKGSLEKGQNRGAAD